MIIIGCQMDLSYGILVGITPNRVPEGFTEEDSTVGFASPQHQVDGSSSGMIMALLPILKGVSPEAPQLRSAGCDLKPMVANEEEVVRPLLQPSEM